MGVLCDLFVADPNDANKYASPYLVRDFENAEFKGLTNLNFEILWAILLHEEWEPRRHRLEEIWVNDNGEEWLFRFPTVCVELMALLDAPTIQSAATAWARTEELSDWLPVEIEPIVSELTGLARIALVEKRSLYLWGSL